MTAKNKNQFYFMGYFVLSVFLFIGTFWDGWIYFIDFFVILLCLLSIFRSIVRLKSYQKVMLWSGGKNRREVRKFFFVCLDKKQNYYIYVVSVLCIWGIFIFFCYLGKRFLILFPGFCLAGLYFLKALDILFFSGYCVLNGIVNFFFQTGFSGCAFCPVKGWDILILISPVFLLLEYTRGISQVFLWTAIFLGFLCFAFWEWIKFFLLENTIKKQKKALEKEKALFI